MKNSNKFIITAISLLALGYIGYEINAFVNGTGPSCDTLSYDQAIATISTDFLVYRMPRWHKDSMNLGTKTPALAFDEEGTQVTDVYFVPFRATGPAGTISYFAMYECKTGTIEYSVKLKTTFSEPHSKE